MPHIALASKFPFAPFACPQPPKTGVTPFTWATLVLIRSKSSSVKRIVTSSSVVSRYSSMSPLPMLSNSSLICPLTPFPIAITIITEAIPMIMPSIVRTERPLLLLIFIRAIFIYSHICAISITMPFPLLHRYCADFHAFHNIAVYFCQYLVAFV